MTRVGEPEGERKQLTVLFADVKGSMDLQENLDPEEWARIMAGLVQILTEGVRRFGGTVDKFTGDGIMALFGAPVAQEDHARRACRAALQLVKAVGEYAGQLRARQEIELRIRLGLASGEAVVGRVGEDLTLDPTALGHTVGLAQRMEAMAEPGTVYLTEHTARLVEGWFRLRELGPKPVKGARMPVRVYALEGPAAPSAGRRGGTALGTAPLVGRERELAVLEDALATSVGGRAQVVGVVGEAGVGKSRLCDEFVRSAAARGFTVRRSAGVSHGREVPLLPVLALLRDYFGVTELDDPGSARDKVSERVLELDAAVGDDLPLLLDFLEVPDPARPVPRLAPEVRARRILDALRRLIRRRSEQEVLVILVEDLHWFDPQSEAFLERLIESYPGSRTLVVTNFRPEFSARWMRHSYYRQLPVAALGDTAVGQMLGGLLGIDLSLAALPAFVQERTGGNPFFVEEVVRALLEDGTLQGRSGHFRLTRPLGEVEVPASVQAVLAARMDRLPAEKKAILQTAAVIGRSFTAQVLAAVVGSAAEVLEEVLAGLCAAELIQEVTRYPVVEYRFWHPLTQEVAYRSLLAERRRRLHAATARAIIELDVDRLDERAALIASHFEAAGEAVEAARWHIRAAAHTVRTDVDDAVRRWRAALALLETTSENDDALGLSVMARIRLAQYGVKTGVSGDDVDALLTQAKVTAERLGDVRLLTAIAVFRFVRRWVVGQFIDAAAEIDTAARLSRDVDDVGVVAGVMMDGALSTIWTGPVADGLRMADETIRLCGTDRQAGVSYWGYSPRHSALRTRVELLALSGRLDEAFQEADQLLAEVRADGGYETVSWILSTYPWLTDVGGFDRDTTGLATEAVKLTEEAGNWAWHLLAVVGLGLAHVRAGRPQQAVAVLTEGLENGQARGIHLEDAQLWAHLARARLLGGDAIEARRAADQSVSIALGQGAKVVACLTLLTRARILRLTDPQGMNDRVDADTHAALALVAETGAKVYEPQLREERARLRGDEAELREALRLYEAIGATGHARRLGAELAGSAVSRAADLDAPRR